MHNFIYLYLPVAIVALAGTLAIKECTKWERENARPRHVRYIISKK